MIDDPHVIALRRQVRDDGPWTLCVVNTDREHTHAVSTTSLADAGHPGWGRDVTPGRRGGTVDEHPTLSLHPSEIRIFAGGALPEHEGRWHGSCSPLV
jgi:hypothetical protein